MYIYVNNEVSYYLIKRVVACEINKRNYNYIYMYYFLTSSKYAKTNEIIFN